MKFCGCEDEFDIKPYKNKIGIQRSFSDEESWTQSLYVHEILRFALNDNVKRMTIFL